jgi:hypothetical protein
MNFPSNLLIEKSCSFDGFSIELIKRSLGKGIYWQIVKRINGDIREEFDSYDKKGLALEAWFNHCEKLKGISVIKEQKSLF